MFLLRCSKNRRCGSVLRRGCWCSKACSKVVNCVWPVAWCEHVLDLCPKAFCPVHHLAPLIGNIPEGTLLFKGVTPAAALANLRKILEELKVPNAMAYRTHDLRRGHARDLQLNGAFGLLLRVKCASVVACGSGASLYEILAAGEWRSPGFLKVWFVLAGSLCIMSDLVVAVYGSDVTRARHGN